MPIFAYSKKETDIAPSEKRSMVSFASITPAKYRDTGTAKTRRPIGSTSATKRIVASAKISRVMSAGVIAVRPAS